MGIEMNTPKNYLIREVEERIDALYNALAYRLLEIADECVNEARRYNGKQYQDQTNNLRSSTGFTLLINGEAIMTSDFAPCGSGTDGDGMKGQSTGLAYVREVAQQYPTGIVMIVVAGMEYAEYLNAKGYNVLDSAKIMADKEIPKLLKELGAL